MTRSAPKGRRARRLARRARIGVLGRMALASLALMALVIWSVSLAYRAPVVETDGQSVAIP